MNVNPKSVIGIGGGLLAFISIAVFGNLDPENPAVTYTLATAVLMAVLWITEAIPLAITSLIPVVLFPIMGVMNGKEVSTTYFNHVIFLFIGGFLIALAMQKWDVHKRIALRILMVTGISHGRILLGLMLATTFLSMWISNTATAMMMVPILISIIQKLEEIMDKKDIQKYSIGLLLGVAYGASIGGIATLVGTPPNLSFSRIFLIMFPGAPEITFANWFFFALPVTLIFFIIVWAYLMLLYKPKKSKIWIGIDTFRQQYQALGKASLPQKIILIDFILLAFFWLTRSEISLGNFSIPGWSSLLSHPEYVNDGTVAIMMSVVLFFIPAGKSSKEKLMDWGTASKIPWNIVLLFGGGFALASGFKESGLSIWFGNQLEFVSTFHPILVIATICFMMTFLTELTSNTATTEMLLPILAGLAMAIEINPLLFMLPATLSGSMAFMLPVATPPNAIIFGTGKIGILSMAKTGFILNILGVIVITLATWFLGRLFFDIDLTVFPDWAIIK
jgi:sodium-dependent dicarboxylate transporter 2/3/5